MTQPPPQPRLALICSSLSLGGLELNFARIAVWLMREGYPFVFFAVKRGPLFALLQQEGVAVEEIDRNWKYYDLEAALALRKKLKKFGIRTMLIRDTRDLSLCALVKSTRGGKMGLIYLQGMQLGVRKRDVLHTIRFNQIDRWITLLPYMARQVQLMTRFDPSRIRIIPLGTELAQFTAPEPTREQARAFFNLPPQATVVGMLGRIDPLKGQHLLIEACGNLHTKGKKVHVLLVGDPTEREGSAYYEALKRQIDLLGLGPFVHLHPFLAETALYFRAVDISVVATESETFGMVTVEALAAGCVVVGSNSGGTPELLGKGEFGYLFEPGNATDLTQVLDAALSEPREMEALRQKCAQHAAERYSHTTFIASLIEVLQEVESEV